MKMPKRAIIGSFLLSTLLLVPFAHALVSLSGSGKRYPVIETSNHNELIERIKAESEKIKENSQTYTVTLKKQPEIAEKEEIRKIATTYIQPHDVINRNGKIILAKGTRIEPLKYLKLPVIIVVEDDPIHLEWAQKKKAEIEKKEKQAVFILLSSGSARQVAGRYHMRVYHLDDRYMDRFNIKRVPCTIRQKGLLLELHEYPL